LKFLGFKLILQLRVEPLSSIKALTDVTCSSVHFDILLWTVLTKQPLVAFYTFCSPSGSENQ